MKEIPITLEEYLDTTKSAVRVESESSDGEFLRVYLVSHRFPDRCETWLMIETKFDAGQEKYYTYLPKAGVQDRDGRWWMLSHTYHHTETEMLRYREEYGYDYQTTGSHIVKYITLEEL